jgi:MYXO-CTERM domain-containing protein
MFRCIFSGGARRAALQAAALLGITVVPAVSHAHFYLDSPENWVEQDSQGDPQKTGPCGSEMNPTETDVVTPYMGGDTIMIQLHETIGHPGHFRVAIGVDGPDDLPPLPTPTGTCGSIAIQDPPVFPVLADGALEHTAKLNGMQTIAVTLPADLSCTSCSLQVVQWMQGSTMGCFYHHCANISVTPTTGSGGMGSGGMSSGGAPSAGGAAGQGAGGRSTASGGMGGTLGQAGTAPMTGGTGGGSGATGAGSSGVPGASGSASSTGGASMVPMGGQSSAAGGSPGAGGSAGGMAPTGAGGTTGTPGGAEPPAEAGGCSLSPANTKPTTTMLSLAGLLALGFAFMRRRRR